MTLKVNAEYFPEIINFSEYHQLKQQEEIPEMKIKEDPVKGVFLKAFRR